MYIPRDMSCTCFWVCWQDDVGKPSKSNKGRIGIPWDSLHRICPNISSCSIGAIHGLLTGFNWAQKTEPESSKLIQIETKSSNFEVQIIQLWVQHGKQTNSLGRSTWKVGVASFFQLTHRQVRRCPQGYYCTGEEDPPLTCGKGVLCNTTGLTGPRPMEMCFETCFFPSYLGSLLSQGLQFVQMAWNILNPPISWVLTTWRLAQEIFKSFFKAVFYEQIRHGRC